MRQVYPPYNCNEAKTNNNKGVDVTRAHNV